jgi:hypothetical protein
MQRIDGKLQIVEPKTSSARRTVVLSQFAVRHLVPHCCDPNPGAAGIINEQTGALIISHPVDNIVSVTVPNLGTFRLTPCRQAQC